MNRIQKIKQEQKALIEVIAQPQDWVKQEIITICDEQISAMPELDLQRYVIAIKSFEHPNGFKLGMDVHPCLRIREGAIVRDHGHNPEGFFWTEKAYQKMKTKAKCYMIGTTTGRYLENYIQLRNRLTNQEDGEQLSFKVARSREPLEVFELPAEQRIAVLVTNEIAQVLEHKLLESYNDDNADSFAPVEVGDLLVQDFDPDHLGLYYRVDKKTANETYRKGTL